VQEESGAAHNSAQNHRDFRILCRGHAEVLTFQHEASYGGIRWVRNAHGAVHFPTELILELWRYADFPLLISCGGFSILENSTE